MLNLYNKILINSDTFKIWKKLDNDCYIATMGYSNENAKILLDLLKSFEEQYGEIIDLDSAKEELMLYENNGKLFLYLDENMKPISMNGCLYNYENDSVIFESNRDLDSLYFYGLSTLPMHRGKGACTKLVNFAIDYAKYNDFDYVYARTDLNNSNSEGIMKKAGMEICKYNGDIIAEWVDVTEDIGDNRLHLWLPFKDDIKIYPSETALFATDDKNRLILKKKKN